MGAERRPTGADNSEPSVLAAGRGPGVGGESARQNSNLSAEPNNLHNCSRDPTTHSDAAQVGVNSRMEQLAAAMELRLQAQEGRMADLHEALSASTGVGCGAPKLMTHSLSQEAQLPSNAQLPPRRSSRRHTTPSHGART